MEVADIAVKVKNLRRFNYSQRGLMGRLLFILVVKLKNLLQELLCLTRLLQ